MPIRDEKGGGAERNSILSDNPGRADDEETKKRRARARRVDSDRNAFQYAYTRIHSHPDPESRLIASTLLLLKLMISIEKKFWSHENMIAVYVHCMASLRIVISIQLLLWWKLNSNQYNERRRGERGSTSNGYGSKKDIKWMGKSFHHKHSKSVKL